MGIVHHVRRIASGRTHVDFQCDEVTSLAQARTGAIQAEELEMHETAFDVEGVHRAASDVAQRLVDEGLHVIGEFQAFVHDVHDGRRPGRHGLEDGIAVAVDDGVVGADVARDELLENIGCCVGSLKEEVLQFLLVVEFMGFSGTDANVGFSDEGKAGLCCKLSCFLESLHAFQLSRGWDSAFGIVFLHFRLTFDGLYAIGMQSGGDVEVGAEACILLEPVFVV